MMVKEMQKYNNDTTVWAKPVVAFRRSWRYRARANQISGANAGKGFQPSNGGARWCLPHTHCQRTKNSDHVPYTFQSQEMYLQFGPLKDEENPKAQRGAFCLGAIFGGCVRLQNIFWGSFAIQYWIFYKLLLDGLHGFGSIQQHRTMH